MSSLFSSVFVNFEFFVSGRWSHYVVRNPITPFLTMDIPRLFFWAILCRVNEACSLQNTEGFLSNPWVLKESLRYFPVLNFFQKALPPFLLQLHKSCGIKKTNSQKGMEMAPGLHPNVWRGHEKVSNDQFWYENISVLCLADVWVSHGVGDGSRTPPRSMEQVWIKFQITNFTMPNNVSSMIYALKSVPSLADVGFPMGTGMARELHPDVRRGSWKSFKWQTNNVSSVKYALKSVPSLANVGVCPLELQPDACRGQEKHSNH